MVAVVEPSIQKMQGETVRKGWKEETEQIKNEQRSTMEEVEIFEEFVALDDNKENPCAFHL